MAIRLCGLVVTQTGLSPGFQEGMLFGTAGEGAGGVSLPRCAAAKILIFTVSRMALESIMM